MQREQTRTSRSTNDGGAPTKRTQYARQMLAPNNVLLLVHDKKYQADPAMQKLSNETTSIASKMPLSAHRHVPPMDRSIINQTTENLFVQGPTSQTKYTSKSPMSNTGCKLKNSHQSRLHSSKSSLTISWQCRYLQFFFRKKCDKRREKVESRRYQDLRRFYIRGIRTAF